MATTISTQDLENVKEDIEDIGQSSNERIIINPRYGAPYKSIPLLSDELQAAIEAAAASGAGANGWTDLLIQTEDGTTQRAKNSSFQSQINEKASASYLDAALTEQTQTVNTALSQLSTQATKFYPTLAAANADIANIAVNQPVQVGESGVNGGLYYKPTAEATTLTKSAYDPLAQAKGYADANALFNPKTPDSTNLNNLGLGFYLQSAPPANAVTELNYPLREACYIHVEGRPDSSLKTQSIYFPNSKRNFKRDFNGTTWETYEITSLGANVVTKAMLTPSLRDSLPKYFEWSPVGAAWNVTYDPSTKTLTWPHMLLGASADYPNTLRIRIPAGSVTITAPTGYDYIYLDLTNVDPLLGNAQLSDVKVGTYAASGYLQKNNQILLAKLDFAGNIHAGVGVPDIRTIGQNAATGATNTFRVKKTATELFFYTKATNGNLIRYRFYRQVKPFDGSHPMSQSDFWRLANVDEVTNVDAVVKVIAEDAEWDCALRVMGAADHVGGVHGDELQDTTNFAPYFLLDGCKVAQDAVFDKQIHNLKFIQESLIFLENTQTQLCLRKKVMEVDNDGFITNYQSLDFDITRQMFTGWVFLAPIKRKVNNDNTGAQITDTFIRFPNYIPENVAEAGFTQVYTETEDGDEFVISGTTSGVSFWAKLYDFKGLPKPVTHLSSAAFYNKMYFSAFDSRVADYTVNAGDKWEVTSKMRIDVAV